MNEEHFADEDNVYVYPNQHLPYFRDVADIFEEDGLDYENSDVLFVGGTMYAHDFKDDHPEADVDVVERNPLTAYLQAFVSHQFAQGYNQDEVKAQLFDYSAEVENGVLHTWNYRTELEAIGIDREDLNNNIKQHQDFASSNWWNHDYGFAEDILYESEFEREEPEFSFSEILLDKLGAKNLDSEKSLHRIRELKNHSKEHEDDVTWAHLIEGVGEDGPDRLTLSDAGKASYNWEEVLKDVNSFSAVDNIRIEDVRNASGEYDAIFFNNVFDYVDSERTTNIIDSLSSEEGAYLEVTLLGWSNPDEGRVVFDDHMPEEIELMEHGPDADFYWKRWPEDQKGVKESPNKVRLYRPENSVPGPANYLSP